MQPQRCIQCSFSKKLSQLRAEGGWSNSASFLSLIAAVNNVQKQHNREASSKFTYKANFILKKNKVLFDETFKFKNIPKIRNQTHTLQKIDVEKFIDDMGRYGLELKKTTTLDSKGYKEQNILYFQKS